MSALTPRQERILLAAGLALILAVVFSLVFERRSFAAINRGDFPAFYTLALLASEDNAYRFYDLERQREIQNSVWPSLSGTVLPAAYPAYLAFLIRPLALLDADTARVVWVGLMLGCVVAAARVLSRSVPSLRGLGWQIGIAIFLFWPLFVGVVGGQMVGLSFLCYAVLFALDKRRSRAAEMAAGVVAGIWMVKPHFGLGVAALFLVERRWVALSTWFVMSLLLWLLGAAVAGPDWVGAWVVFARHFSEIDLATNAYQMTGVIGALYSLVASLGLGGKVSAEQWDKFSLSLALLVPVGLLLASRASKRDSRFVNAPLLSLGPLLVLFAPVVNFYDLSIALVPLIVLMKPSVQRDVLIAASVLCASQLVGLGKSLSVPGLAFVVALGMSILCWKAVVREARSERAV